MKLVVSSQMVVCQSYYRNKSATNDGVYIFNIIILFRSFKMSVYFYSTI